ncbi:hypothetical protein [Xenorhabdus griffiniae]|uniref:Uncharacterized protein n=1 Tax=Xenorhabdus griffiniae TaxID=351672 RepID=A0ABY9XKG6_9GAMM|nr:hypothetical protein [Xenorhabdus griffiniae]MBD1228932.1 hypothetical protein [Xenorhabdus griffiniae]MBE8588506.1 hypothetical protein [Xenorhabdus griffiniae]WMV73444.1 hypothetical protein QL128_05300 [Xenorhabdus griffiniae]WNH03123.1 hypothetical protein QL112_005305 [Xenorhabdus griffiniae]
MITLQMKKIRIKEQIRDQNLQSRDPEFPNYPLIELATLTKPQLPDWPRRQR